MTTTTAIKAAETALIKAFDSSFALGIKTQAASVTCLFALKAFDDVNPVTPCAVIDYSMKGFTAWTENRLCVVLKKDWADLDRSYRALMVNTAIIHHFNRKTGFKLFVSDKPNGMGKILVNRASLPEKYQNKDEASQQAESFTSLVKIASWGLWGKKVDAKSSLETTLGQTIKLLSELDIDKPESVSQNERNLLAQLITEALAVDDMLDVWKTKEAHNLKAKQDALQAVKLQESKAA